MLRMFVSAVLAVVAGYLSWLTYVQMNQDASGDRMMRLRFQSALTANDARTEQARRAARQTSQSVRRGDRDNTVTVRHDVRTAPNTTSKLAFVPHPIHVSRVANAAPRDPDARAALARDLQRELRRAGCYPGKLDGDWGPASKFAMSQFVQRVNAILPVDEPDLVLLALVHRHTGFVCGQACRDGQIRSSGGRCFAVPILVQAPRQMHQQQRVVVQRSVIPTSTTITPQLPTRLAQPTTARHARPPKMIGQASDPTWRPIVRIAPQAIARAPQRLVPERRMGLGLTVEQSQRGAPLVAIPLQGASGERQAAPVTRESEPRRATIPSARRLQRERRLRRKTSRVRVRKPRRRKRWSQSYFQSSSGSEGR